MAPASSGRCRPLLQLVIALLPLSAGCQDRSPGRIVFPLPWRGYSDVIVAREAIQSWEGHERVEFPDSTAFRVPASSGYALEVDFATAASALPRVAVAVGAQSSRSTLLVAPVYAARGIPLIVPTSTSNRLQRLGDWLFQLPPNDQAEGEFMVTYAVDHLAARRITIFYLVGDEYGVGLRDGVVAALRRQGLAPADQVGVITTTDFAARVAQSLRRASPDAVIIATRTPEALAITRALAPRSSAPVIWGDAAGLDVVHTDSVGGATGRTYAVEWWDPGRQDSVSRAFVSRYRAATGRLPRASEAMYHDALMLAARAVIDGGGDSAGVRRYLASLGRDRPAYRGVTGDISFGPERVINLVMTRLDSGRVVVAHRGGAR